ncbi:hypothetical protein GCM10011520_18270 [Shewanella carassii]|uniref:DUF3149 domain-containing protein n=1 Tax=Shewanella carassii TaxID=1987584 RepID=A0ABQ1T3K9_9GAMM|nr:hypothetical protein GCM10011520_18270 [Shewanella carassii]GHA98947.1 hypothetical protein GCM10007107_09800 [Shewanella indica]
MKWLSKVKVEDLFPTEYALVDSFGLSIIFKLIIFVVAFSWLGFILFVIVKLFLN